MSKISVLVVDDASFIRDLVKKCLRNYFPGIRTEDAVNNVLGDISRGKLGNIFKPVEIKPTPALDIITF